jgi:dienelactone hydrolase
MKFQFALISTLLLLSLNAFAEIQSKEIQYELNGTVMTGFMAWDDEKKGKRPGVLVVHEWWGQNDYARKRAKDLAEEGYVGFALDMYGDKKVATHPEDAGKFMNEIMSRADEMLARFNAGKAQLKTSELVDVNNIAAIGYCFGGAVVLNVARNTTDLAGVVSFHGNLSALKSDTSTITTPMLVLNGADDPFVKPESIENFKDEMNARNANYEFINYPKAKHSFTNPGATAVGKEFSLPLEYNEYADKKSWKAMKKFLKKSFSHPLLLAE